MLLQQSRFRSKLLIYALATTTATAPVRIAVLSDIHSNLDALEATLRTLDERGGADAVYCLGDVVGYGADAAACVERVRERCDGVVMGNHDAAVAREEGMGVLPSDGQAAARNNREQLSDEQLDWLASLPLTLEAHGLRLVHASPDRPAAWTRLDGFRAAKAQFDAFDEAVCFVGHTHRPAIMADSLGVLSVRSGNRYLINPGSVGQPRDENPRAGFGLFDPDAFDYENVRVPYDTERAAEKVRAAGLPDRLARRLLRGK
ncbi:MAG: metallophosphoesterase [Bacteroidetes bacterium QS_8_68_15]|nr:MAG: metallophosphoesterase [Bacteroidetes bacterium QS_8_68_15]